MNYLNESTLVCSVKVVPILWREYGSGLTGRRAKSNHEELVRMQPILSMHNSSDFPMTTDSGRELPPNHLPETDSSKNEDKRRKLRILSIKVLCTIASDFRFQISAKHQLRYEIWLTGQLNWNAAIKCYWGNVSLIRIWMQLATVAISWFKIELSMKYTWNIIKWSELMIEVKYMKFIKWNKMLEI